VTDWVQDELNNGRKRNVAAYEISKGGIRAAGTRSLSGRAGGLLHGGTKSREAARVAHHYALSASPLSHAMTRALEWAKV
jgi:hypothetical protein